MGSEANKSEAIDAVLVSNPQNVDSIYFKATPPSSCKKMSGYVPDIKGLTYLQHLNSQS